MAFQLFVYLVGEAQACVIHREQESFDFERGIELRLDYAYGVEQLADALGRSIRLVPVLSRNWPL